MKPVRVFYVVIAYLAGFFLQSQLASYLTHGFDDSELLHPSVNDIMSWMFTIYRYHSKAGAKKGG